MTSGNGFGKFVLGVLVGVGASLAVRAAMHHSEIEIDPTRSAHLDIVEQTRLDKQAQLVRQMQDGQEFAENLVRNSVSPGRVADVLLEYVAPNVWRCQVSVRSGSGGTHTEEQADAPARACTKAVLSLDKAGDL